MAVELLSFYIPCNSYASPLFNTGVSGIISLYQNEGRNKEHGHFYTKSDFIKIFMGTL